MEETPSVQESPEGASRPRLALVLLVLLLVVLGGLLRADTLHLSRPARAAAPYGFSIEGWVVGNLPEKLLGWVSGLLPGPGPTQEEQLRVVDEYFRLGDELRRTGAVLDRAVAHRGPGGEGAAEVAATEERQQELLARRDAIRAPVETTLQQALGAVLVEQGLRRGTGVFRTVFPPPVFRLDRPPKLLVVSPRDRIQMVETRLLHPDLTLAEMETIEDQVAGGGDRSALVLTLDGLAVYPSLVPDSQVLRTALATAAHEWLHQYWIFSPLGQAYWASREMTTLNETAAEIGGRELGDLVYARLGFQAPQPAASPPEAQEPPPGTFVFARAMRETRLEVDRLLDDGRVEQAEAYMEERRRLFVDHGYRIRKLNQAYFAFYGTYGTSPESSSPIASQLVAVRARATDVGDFVRTVSGFGDLEAWNAYLEALPDAAS